MSDRKVNNAVQIPSIKYR